MPADIIYGVAMSMTTAQRHVTVESPVQAAAALAAD